MYLKGITMSELRNSMIKDMQLAGLVEGSRRWSISGLSANSLPTTWSRLINSASGKVEDYVLYVRDDLGIAKGTFDPMFAGLKFFYLNTLGYDWPLFTKKKSASHAREAKLPDVRSDEDCRRLIATLEKTL